MIISQTPLRISFLGGGTDYPEYYLRHGGETLGTAINQYTTVTVHPLTKFVDYQFRIHYSNLESVDHEDKIQHTTARECLRFLKQRGGLEIYYADDLPARSGLGSSSAATVGLLHALHAMQGDRVTQNKLADEAIHIEREMVKDLVGSQDQYMCALGGLQHLKFQRNGKIIATRIALSQERLHALQKHLLLVYTGRQRLAHAILDEQVERTQSGVNDHNLSELKALVSRGVAVLSGEGDIEEFGALLHDGWMLKRKLSRKVSNASVDEMYESARESGALGGKLLGAGSGGFLLFFVEPKKRARVIQSLGLPEAPFLFEENGSRIIFNQSRA